ncbi:meiosis-specific nuclear structural protein 1-like [Vespa mandarinia]|uniref:meiosis-specific nuclear structural protein 1-like n=1 Tax=Vespa mandarinia TaxID=7446 RepID=UPI00161D122F|nr:meiosis-specific nuclear structural protein 1-like [Vespa mandarinia]
MQVRENLEILESKKMMKDAREDEIELERERIMKKGDIVRSIRRLDLNRLEIEEKEKLVSSQKARDLRNRQIERSYKLAQELARLKNEEARELRDLKCKKKLFRSPTACSFVDLQSRLLEEKIKKDSQSIDIIRQWYFDDTLDKMQLAKLEENKLLYRADLQNQIIEKRRILREFDEERQRERKIIEQMIDVIHEEDIRAEERKKEIQTCLQAEKEATFEAKKVWKDIQKATINEENKKIAEIIVEKEIEHKRQMEKKKDISAMREATTEKIARKMLDDEIKMKEKEAICNELYLEKKKTKEAEESLRLALEKRLRAKKILDEMVQYRIAATEKKMKEQYMEINFTHNLYEKQLKLDEEAKQKLEEKRRKNNQYGEDLRKIIINNKVEYAMKLLKKQKDIQDECAEKS